MLKVIFALIFCLCTVSGYAAACTECHELADVVPADHEKVQFSIDKCTECHTTKDAGEADLFASKIHTAHTPPDAECSVCHIWEGDAPYTIKGTESVNGTTSDADLINDMLASWRDSEYLDRKHGASGVFCTGCHGEGLPEFAADVENSACLNCHGPMEELQKKSEPEKFKDRNPHKSHLGEVACTLCHHMHSAQEVYCIECHKKFEMKIP